MLHQVCQEIVHGLLSGLPTAVLAALTAVIAPPLPRPTQAH